VACPYFFPIQKSETIAWAFPQRLPLGAGFCGTCRTGNEEFVPDDATLRDSCNLGHALGCSRMPVQRRADAVRFVVAIDSGERIALQYVYDREHAPVEYGQLEYDCKTRAWATTLADVCVQQQAECYLSTYLDRRRRSKSG